MNYRQDHPAWIYVRCASVNAATAFDRLYDLIDEAAGHGFLVRGTSFDHCSGNTLKDRNGLRAMLDAVEEGIEARAPLTTHFRGGKAAMKERLLSIASGGTRKKGVALVCAAALVISAGAAACSLGTAGEPRQLNGILDRENYALRGVGEYVAAFDAAGGFIVDLGDLTEPGEARPPAWGMIVSRYDPKPARLCRPGDHLRHGDVRRRRQSRPPGRGGGGDRGGSFL